MKPLYRERVGVCSRAWMFMGEQGGPCDQKCQMCYYAHQDNLVFYSLPTMIQHANMYRHYYGIDACDITGGEPTVFKDIVSLVQHCARIGLRPTIITHGQNNRPDFRNGLCRKIEEAGLDDWLISLHGGSDKSHDAILCSPGSFDRLIDGLNNVSRPVRFNTTIQRENFKDLPFNILLDQPPTVWNAINFNPFRAWAGNKKDEIDFQVSYAEAAPHLAHAVDVLEAAGWEVNVRYWPLCIAKEHGFLANVSGYHQVSFDPWEWRLNATNRTQMEIIEQNGGWYEAERKQAIGMMQARNNLKCRDCSLAEICDKPPEQYQSKYGLDELTSQDGEKVTDPTIFTAERRRA